MLAWQEGTTEWQEGMRMTSYVVVGSPSWPCRDEEAAPRCGAPPHLLHTARDFRMQIRSAQPQDHAQWLPLWQGYQRFYEAELPQAVTDLTWARFLDPREPMHCAVAEIDGRLVGLVHFIYHRSCWTAGDYCYLQDLFALESHRGRGIGRALIEHVYAEARAAGASRVHWLTQEHNHQARQLYDRIASRSGFIQYRQLFESH